MRAVGLALLALLACGDPPPRVIEAPPVETPPVGVEAQILARYLGDAAFRRATLEQSLVNPDNGYSRDRLAGYGFADAGWELLPTWNPRSIPLGPQHLEQLRTGTLVLPPATRPLWDGATPREDGAWRDLGRRVFTDLPLRADDSIAHALTDPPAAAKLGLVAADDGTYPGLVVFEDVDGRTRVGITCALCHSALHEARPWPGLARRDVDYGSIRLAYHDATGVPLAADLRARMKRWGAGRADITGDDDEDPVAIPDLWRLLELDALTQAGTIALSGDRIADEDERRAHDLVVLAIRQETQVIQANGERARPPRELAWALARFVADLEPPPRPLAVAAGVREGKVSFDRHCRRCHDGPAYSGAPIDAAIVGTDRALADSRARGTGKFRPAPLVAVAGAAPYFHDGTVPTLADVLDPVRMSAAYTGNVRKPGPIAGHAFGTELPASERAALVAYLGTL
jgi:cytochrome c5